jgi:transglutaminase-like putative cysteine protease
MKPNYWAKIAVTMFCVIALMGCHGEIGYNSNTDYIIKTHKVKRVKASLGAKISMPALDVNEWILITPKPPEHGTQSLLKYQAFLNGNAADIALTNELSPAKREMFLKRFNTDAQNNHGVDIRIEYEMELFSRELVPGKYGTPVEELDDVSKARYLQPSKTIDWDREEFRSWLAQNSELIKKPSQSDIAFAYKVFRFIAEKGKYSPENFARANKTPSLSCRSLTTDCVGFSSLFTAVMRANGVPARTLAGRWASTGDSFHVKAEFWAKNTGWVPVDVTSAVLFKHEDKYFGRDGGDFITFHTDNDIIVDNIYWGSSELWGSQGWLYWVRASGGSDAGKSFKDSWAVEEIKTDENK